jgi:tetratricopeptide (TPR) repeat protein
VWYIIIFIVALSLRLLYFFQSKSADPLFSNPIMDALYHHEWAVSIVRDNWIGTSSFFRAPLYPYFLAMIYKLFGINMIAPRLVQIFMGSGSCLLTQYVGTRVYNKKIGICAGFIAAAYPLFIYFDNELLIPTLFIFLFMLGFAVLVRRDLNHISGVSWFSAGILWGCAAIARPNILLFLVVMLVWIFRTIKKQARKAVLFCVLGISIIVLPVTLRNYLVSREFVLIAWQGGTNFYIGNNPYSDGYTAIIPGTRKTWWGGYNDAKYLAENAEGRPLTNAEIDQYWLKQGIDFITSQPLRALGLFVKKAYLFFGGLELSNNRDIYFFSHLTYLKFLLIRAPMFQFPFGVLFPLALTGIFIFFTRSKQNLADPHQHKAIKIILIYIACYAVSFILFFVCARYRVPLVPFFAIFGSAAIFYLARQLTQRKFRTCLTPAVIFVISYLFFNANPYRVVQKNPALNYNTMGVAFKQQGNIHKAVECYKKAIESEPDQAEAYYNLGNVFAESHDLTTAKKLFEQAIALSPRDARAHNNLGNIYFEINDYEKALYHYYIAINLEPDYITPLYHAGLVHHTQGNIDAAQVLWQRALQINPHDQRILKALEQLP